MDKLRAALLAWHDENARDLPWRGEKDPYRILVSELMLQQTRAETVIPYYRAFLEEFPTARALADADEGRVLKRWEGLGYYSRARNLQKAARRVADAPGGAFPDTVAALLQLPGVGAYTAGAVASMAFGRPEPAIDGNQIRVLCRLFDLRACVSTPDAKRAIRAAALALLDPDRPGDFNQALMGLGALCCVPRKPACARCPVRAYCLAEAAGVAASLPVLPEKIQKKTEQRLVALVYLGDSVFVRRRPDKGLLAGLYEFPSFPGARTDEDAQEALAELGLSVRPLGARGVHRHVFTHLIWQMEARAYVLTGDAFGASGQFVDAQALRDLPMPTALAPFRDAVWRDAP